MIRSCRDLGVDGVGLGCVFWKNYEDVPAGFEEILIVILFGKGCFGLC